MAFIEIRYRSLSKLVIFVKSSEFYHVETFVLFIQDEGRRRYGLHCSRDENSWGTNPSLYAVIQLSTFLHVWVPKRFVKRMEESSCYFRINRHLGVMRLNTVYYRLNILDEHLWNPSSLFPLQGDKLRHTLR